MLAPPLCMANTAPLTLPTGFSPPQGEGLSGTFSRLALSALPGHTHGDKSSAHSKRTRYHPRHTRPHSSSSASSSAGSSSTIPSVGAAPIPEQQRHPTVHLQRFVALCWLSAELDGCSRPTVHGLSICLASRCPIRVERTIQNGRHRSPTFPRVLALWFCAPLDRPCWRAGWAHGPCTRIPPERCLQRPR